MHNGFLWFSATSEFQILFESFIARGTSHFLGFSENLKFVLLLNKHIDLRSFEISRYVILQNSFEGRSVMIFCKSNESIYSFTRRQNSYKSHRISMIFICVKKLTFSWKKKVVQIVDFCNIVKTERDWWENG